MAYGLEAVIAGADIAANPGLRNTTSDELDAIVRRYGNDIVRIDPRDFKSVKKRTPLRMPPNGDFAYFSGTGFSVGPVAGKCAGEDLFRFTNAGASAAGTDSNLKIGPKSFISQTAFSIFGVGSLDASMYGAGSHMLLGLRNLTTNAFGPQLMHEYLSGKDYLRAYMTPATGYNHDLSVSTLVAPGVPFAYLWQVKQSGASRVTLRINGLSNLAIDSAGSGPTAPTNGATRLHFGCGTADAAQWSGPHWRAYYVPRAVMETADDAAIADEVMLAMMIKTGIV